MEIPRFLLFVIAVITNFKPITAFRLSETMETDSEEYTEVRFGSDRTAAAGHLHRRLHESRDLPHRGSRDLPRRLDTKFYVGGKAINLHLTKNKALSSPVPVYVMNGKKIVREDVTDQKHVGFYRDGLHEASIMLEYNKKGRTYTVMGTFSNGDFNYVIEPVVMRGNNTGRRNHNQHRVFRQKGKSDTTIYNEPFHNMKSVRRKRGGSRRTYYIELLICIDTSIYTHFYDKSTSLTSRMKGKDAKREAYQFYKFVLNGIDMRYRRIKDLGYTLSVIPAGIFIADTPETADWPSTSVSSNILLSQFGNWVNQQLRLGSLPEHDHAMMFTIHLFDLWFGLVELSDETLGRANLKMMCTGNSQSVVAENFDSMSVIIATHELAHSLGASHDGDMNTCDPDQNYLMTPGFGVSKEIPVRNYWAFSRCSVNDIREQIARLTRNDNNCLTTIEGKKKHPARAQSQRIRNKYPGEVYSGDSQCRMANGEDSYVCRVLYRGQYDGICRGLWCYDHKEEKCTLILAADGTPCGSGKWCESGLCSGSKYAPSLPEYCPMGDQEGMLKKLNVPCSTIARTSHSKCHDPFVRYSCCLSCPKR